MSEMTLPAIGGQLVRICGGSGPALGFDQIGRPLSDTEWERLLRMAVANGVTSHVHAWLVANDDQGPVGANLRDRLRARARASSLRSLALRAELLRILCAFCQSGIDAMPLKGPVLADTYHRRPELREFGDLDILVRAGDLHRAWQLLLNLNYHSPYQNHTLEDRYHIVFRHCDTDEIVELHWRVAGPHFGRYYSGDFLWSDATERSYRNRIRTWMPTTEATLLYLAIHAYKHNWERLNWLLDIPEVLRAPGLDWDSLEQLAIEQGAYRLLRATLQLSWMLFPDCPRPRDGHGLHNRALDQAQLRRIRRLILRPALDRERMGDFFALRVANADCRKDQLRLLLHSSRPSDRDTDTLGRNPWLRPMAALFRPIRLLTRALTGRSRSTEHMTKVLGKQSEPEEK
ncbi:MAG: nucleotidyltransferase family protein [Xanthomonadales bacterium]|nr:nucleotidyltransferase family protein [Xanthomonadales bacterium]